MWCETSSFLHNRQVARNRFRESNETRYSFRVVGRLETRNRFRATTRDVPLRTPIRYNFNVGGFAYRIETQDLVNLAKTDSNPRPGTSPEERGPPMFRSRIFWRLFGVMILLLAAAFAMLGWLLVSRMEAFLLEQTRADLEERSVFLLEWVSQVEVSRLQAEVQRIAPAQAARITLISADGTVLADSDEDPSQTENHARREEVRRAEEAGIGVSSRYSSTVHRPMMYLARRNDQGPVRYVRIAISLETVAEEARAMRQVVWTACGPTFLAALVASWLIARRICAPLIELSTAADRIASGEFGRKVLVSSVDEVGDLARSFNAMSEACANQIAQIERDHYQLRAVFRSMVEGVLVLDVDRTVLFANDAASQLLGKPVAAMQGEKIWQLFRHRQLGDAIERILAADDPYSCDLEWVAGERRALTLQGARLPGSPHRGAVLVFHDITHLRKLETVRQDFVANVSHELKTPLAVIQAAVETLLDGAVYDQKHNLQFLRRIQQSGERLHRLVQDLLSLGRIESSEAELDLRPVSLSMAVDSCLRRHADRAHSRKLLLTAAPPDRPVFVMADDESLMEILDNLVDNALKYTPADGSVTVDWSVDGDRVELTVSDTGVGIPPSDLPRIFERFYRVDKARSRELGGTGLGLSIVKHLVQRLGGSIAASSQVGVGSRFTVVLPVAGSALADANRIRHVVFVCVENSNRSQMAEAFARMHGQGLIGPYSAGSKPSGKVNPKAIEAMREVGCDLTTHCSKSLGELPNIEFDVLVTMGCGDSCPSLRCRQRDDWQIPDPRDLAPDAFRVVRDLIERNVQDLIGRLLRQDDHEPT
ncbi:MAG: HAMP domain-containing protein [Planctomycetes bacterium]|nr:HAMP domain-containing protein [Planctomycetota bacterium]